MSARGEKGAGVVGPGMRIGPYEILSLLGAGGMGEVYRARDPRLGREVAIKVLPAAVASDPGRLMRFEREARATAALNHSNILAVHDVGTFEGLPYLVEELLEGESLRERLANGPLAVADALRIGREIARGLAAAHEKGIVHRDLKPGNVFLTRDGSVKILDFGLAKLVSPTPGPESLAAATTVDRSTELGAVLGTVGYMAPEQARGGTIDPRTDVFALGVVLYEMLARRRPFLGSTATDTLASILKDEPAPLPAGIPPPVGAVVRRCLAKEPDQRYPRGSEVRAALETVLTGAGAAPAPSWRAPGSRRAWLAGAAALLALLAILIALDAGGFRKRLAPGAGSSTRTVRLAVLPFANLSGDAEQDYLCDGLTQELIAQLGRLHPGGLAVIARTSVMRYKETEKPIDQIGRELRVDYVLEGSARREGNRLRITADLIGVRDQTQLWADTFERELSGILLVQSEVARRVASALALELLPAEQAELAAARSVDPEVHDAYLKGIYHKNELTKDGLDTAQRFFELALAKDPQYGPALMGLARVWNSRQNMGFAAPSEAGPKAKAAALAALALDDRSAPAHAALGSVRTYIDWDWPGAETEWRRALELDPNSATEHANYAYFLAIVGRADEATPHIERALDLDPLRVWSHQMHAYVLLNQRRFDDAMVATRRALELQPGWPAAVNFRETLYIVRGMRDQSLASLRSRIAGDPQCVAAFEQGLAAGGYEGAQRRIADLLAARYEASGGIPDAGGARCFGLPGAVAWRYLAAGDHDRAIDWLERGFTARDPSLVAIGSPAWDPLRGNPRFQDLLRRMNLPVG